MRGSFYRVQCIEMLEYQNQNVLLPLLRPTLSVRPAPSAHFILKETNHRMHYSSFTSLALHDLTRSCLIHVEEDERGVGDDGRGRRNERKLSWTILPGPRREEEGGD